MNRSNLLEEEHGHQLHFLSWGMFSKLLTEIFKNTQIAPWLFLLKTLRCQSILGLLSIIVSKLTIVKKFKERNRCLLDLDQFIIKITCFLRSSCITVLVLSNLIKRFKLFKMAWRTSSKHMRICNEPTNTSTKLLFPSHYSIITQKDTTNSWRK